MTKHELNLFQEIQKLKSKLEKKNALAMELTGIDQKVHWIY